MSFEEVSELLPTSCLSILLFIYLYKYTAFLLAGNCVIFVRIFLVYILYRATALKIGMQSVITIVISLLFGHENLFSFFIKTQNQIIQSIHKTF